ncbi:trace amine-associated receptor 1-like [Nerophis ophidion]|uniref:trace amine-associated receptor 1-like n=1 Tax=Nerophis ophidion TaxID=159077 RepID=UPI002AE05903|nr:trace amine-associated receptor 1-like [Nerophis ophidion]
MEMDDQAELCFPQLINISCRKPTVKRFEDVLSSVLLAIISIVTVVLNLLVIVSISHFRQLHTPTNFLLLSLAVSDFLVGLLLIPGQIILQTPCWTLGDVLCFLYNYVSYFMTSASVINMVLISVDRYVAICDPLHYNTKVTVKKVQLCIGLCWFFVLLYCSILFWDQLAHPGKYQSCYGECAAVFDFTTGMFDLVVNFILPLNIIVILYMKVFMVALSQARAMRSNVTSVKPQHAVTVRAKKSELKAARTLGVLVLIFLMCFCPFYIVALAGVSSGSYLTFVVNLFYFNSFLNPVVYALFYSWFRRAIRHIITLQILQPGSWGDNIL